MFHFTPIKKLGGSQSNYSLEDQPVGTQYSIQWTVWKEGHLWWCGKIHQADARWLEVTVRVGPSAKLIYCIGMLSSLLSCIVSLFCDWIAVKWNYIKSLELFFSFVMDKVKHSMAIKQFVYIERGGDKEEKGRPPHLHPLLVFPSQTPWTPVPVGLKGWPTGWDGGRQSLFAICKWPEGGGGWGGEGGVLEWILTAKP